MWRWTLAAENKSPATLDTYLRTVRLFVPSLAARGMPRDIAAIRRKHCEALVQDQLDRHSASTTNTRYRSLQRFFGWAEDEGEIDVSPMHRMRPPKFEECVPEVLEVDDLRCLLETCRGRSFEARRDLAILLLLIDTGMRRGEVASVRCDDLDLNQSLVRVLGKGGRERLVPLGRKLIQALDRYLRVRVTHVHAEAAAPFLGRADHAERRLSDRRDPGARGRDLQRASPPAASFLCPCLAGGRPARDGPHARGRLAQSRDGGSLRGQRRVDARP